MIDNLFTYLPLKIRNILYYRFLYKADFPEILHIESTNACNAECLICAREKMTRAIGFMDFMLFKKIIDECSKYRYFIREIHLHGYGEPLLDKSLFDKISYAKKAGIKKVYFVTNASLLDSETAKRLISSGLDSIKFSFYGATKETYEKIHVGLKYEETENNIRNFINIRQGMKSGKPSVNIQFVPQRDNYAQYQEFLRKWTPVIDKGKGDRIEKFYLHNWIYGRKYNTDKNGRKRLKSCAIPFYIMQILWNGDVVPCVFDFDGKMSLGQVRTKSVRQVWNNEQYRALRAHHSKRAFNRMPLCLGCDQLRGQ